MVTLDTMCSFTFKENHSISQSLDKVLSLPKLESEQDLGVELGSVV